MPKNATRKRFEVNEDQRKLVGALIGYGMPADDVRHLVINPQTNKPVTKKTLYRHFRKEIEAGHAMANSSVLQTAYKIATNPRHRSCASMNIFWQKTRMGFKETDRTEHTGPDGTELGPALIVKTGKRIESTG